MHENVYPGDETRVKYQDGQVVLICEPLFFFSKNDEDIFFEWLDKIKSIKESKGYGKQLHIIFEDKNIPLEDLWDLMGIFTRYNFDYSELYVFRTKENNKWYRKEL